MNKLTAKLLRCNYSMYVDDNGNYVPVDRAYELARYTISGDYVHSLYPKISVSDDARIIGRSYKYAELSDLHRYVTTGVTTSTPKPSHRSYNVIDMLKKLILKMTSY